MFQCFMNQRQVLLGKLHTVGRGAADGHNFVTIFYLIIIIRSKNEKNLPKTKFVNLWFDGI